jgi:4-diphosphocytidyl-2-C-methyl-D-erythritol kinase
MLRPGAIEAPAKINLTLEVLARRSDGYHGIRSVMLPIALHDILRWEPSTRFSFQANAGVPTDDSNLVVRAFRALGLEPPLAVILEKNVPAGAGLGGGSSDAAAILRAAAAGAFGEVAQNDYLAAARSLGSDIPFFLVETGALVEGTGERVTALGALPDWWIVLVVPAVAVDTGRAYRDLDADRDGKQLSRPRNSSKSLEALEAVQRADFARAIAASMNDFEPVIAAREPQVAQTLQSLRAAGARLSQLSGSGSSCFAMAESQEEAMGIARRLTAPEGARIHILPFRHSEAWRAQRAIR